MTNFTGKLIQGATETNFVPADLIQITVTNEDETTYTFTLDAGLTIEYMLKGAADLGITIVSEIS